MDPEPRGCRGGERQTQVLVEGKTMFEHSLIDLETKPVRPRRWISLPVAVGLHVVGLTAIAFASYWNVDTVPEPRVNVVFLSFAPLPDLPAGGGQRPTVKPPVTKDQEKPRAPEQPVQPTLESVPATIPTPPTTPVDNVTPSTGTDDDSPVFSDGPPCPACPPGPGKGPGPGGPDGPGDSRPIVFSIGSGMTRPEIVHQVQPRYTELARQSGTQGAVIVEAIIDQKGYVTNVRVLRGLPMGLDKAAVEAIQQWRFKPATLQGQPVKVYYMLTVNFTIQR
jgi:periplasmic protein TonB